jgi:hypothetical protein
MGEQKERAEAVKAALGIVLARRGGDLAGAQFLASQYEDRPFFLVAGFRTLLNALADELADRTGEPVDDMLRRFAAGLELDL